MHLLGSKPGGTRLNKERYGGTALLAGDTGIGILITAFFNYQIVFEIGYAPTGQDHFILDCTWDQKTYFFISAWDPSDMEAMAFRLS